MVPWSDEAMGVFESTGYIPEPPIVMTGCRPWVNRPAAECPVCKGGIRKGDDLVYCARCDTASPKLEAQVHKARIGLETKGRAEVAEAKARAQFRKHPRLTESHRRQIWGGHKSG